MPPAAPRVRTPVRTSRLGRVRTPAQGANASAMAHGRTGRCTGSTGAVWRRVHAVQACGGAEKSECVEMRRVSYNTIAYRASRMDGRHLYCTADNLGNLGNLGRLPARDFTTTERGTWNLEPAGEPGTPGETGTRLVPRREISGSHNGIVLVQQHLLFKPRLIIQPMHPPLLF